MDYLFVGKRFPGLQRTTAIDVNDVEKKLAKTEVEAVEDVDK